MNNSENSAQQNNEQNSKIAISQNYTAVKL